MSLAATSAERPADPKHIGDNVLPNFPIFNRLLYLAGQSTQLAINDVTYGHKATYAQLLSDVLHVRNDLRKRLCPSVHAQLLRGERVSINLMAPGGYEFSTALLATLAIGAVIVPICEYIRQRTKPMTNEDICSCVGSIGRGTLFCKHLPVRCGSVFLKSLRFRRTNSQEDTRSSEPKIRVYGYPVKYLQAPHKPPENCNFLRSLP